MPRDNNDYGRLGGQRSGRKSGFTVHGINRVIGADPNRRGGYQGPNTRGQISRSLGQAGGGWVGGRSAAQQAGWRGGFR